MIFIGVDLAWTYKNETGICVIDSSGEVLYLDSKVFSDEDIVNKIKEYSYEALCVAIDAPLIVKNETGSRPAEGEFMKDKLNGHHLSVFAVSRAYLSRTYGSIRGESLMNLIIEAMPEFLVGPYINTEKSIILETFPSGLCAGLFPKIYPVKYKIKSKIPYEESKSQLNRLLDRISYLENSEKYISGITKKLDIQTLDITKKKYKHLEDKIDAFLCACGTYLLSRDIASQRVYGCSEKGFISIAVVEEEASNYMDSEKKSDSTNVKSSLNSDDIVELVSSLGEVSKTIDDSKEKQLEALNNMILEVQIIKKKLIE